MTDYRQRLEAACTRAETEYPQLAAPDGTVAVDFTDLRALLNERPAAAIQNIIDTYAIAGANLLSWLDAEDRERMPKTRQRVAGLPVFPPSQIEWQDWANDVACRAFFRALKLAKDSVSPADAPGGSQ